LKCPSDVAVVVAIERVEVEAMAAEITAAADLIRIDLGAKF